MVPLCMVGIASVNDKSKASGLAGNSQHKWDVVITSPCVPAALGPPVMHINRLTSKHKASDIRVDDGSALLVKYPKKLSLFRCCVCCTFKAASGVFHPSMICGILVKGQ
jgi:hypothetical protein